MQFSRRLSLSLQLLPCLLALLSQAPASGQQPAETPNPIPGLLKALAGDDVAKSNAAYGSLSRMSFASRGNLDELFHAADHDNPTVRATVASVLARLPEEHHPRAIRTAWVRLIREESPSIRWTLTEALSRLKAKSRQDAAATIVREFDDTMAEWLDSIEAVEDDTAWRKYAAMMADSCFPKLLRLEDHSGAIRIWLLARRLEPSPGNTLDTSALPRRILPELLKVILRGSATEAAYAIRAVEQFAVRDAAAEAVLLRVLAGEDEPPAVGAFEKRLQKIDLTYTRDDVRVLAASCLSSVAVDRARATETLLPLLVDDSGLSLAAACSLARLGNSKGLNRIRKVLYLEKDPDIVISMLGILGHLGSKADSAVIHVLPFLKASPETVNAAQVCLARIGQGAVQPMLQFIDAAEPKAVETVCSSFELMVPLPEAARVGLLERFEKAKPIEKTHIAMCLIEHELFPDALLRSLLTLTDSPDSATRQLAIFAMSDHESLPADVIDGVIRLLDHEDSTVAGFATSALQKQGKNARRASPALRGLIERDTKYSFTSPITALGYVGGEESVPLLIQQFTHADAGRRRNAAGALRELGSRVPAVIKALTAALQDDDPTVRVQAAHSLAALTKQPEPALETIVRVLDDAASNGVPAGFASAWSAIALGTLGPVALPRLTQMLLDENETTGGRLTAASTILEIDSTRADALNFVAQSLRNGDPFLRLSAASTIGSSGPKSDASEWLIQLRLEDPDPSVQRNAWSALQQLRGR